MEIERIFNGLESNQTQECEDAKQKLLDHISQNKADWLVQGMMDYFLKTGSVRIVEVLVKLQTPYDIYIFDRLADWLKTPAQRVPALNLFFFVVRKHPTWLYKVKKHRLIKEIFRILLTEKEIVPLMSSLICIITLMPIIPNSVPHFLFDLFDVFGHLATWNAQNPNRLADDKLVHLQLGVQMLFHRLYGMFPCNFVAYLSSEFCKKEQNTPIFHHTIKPLLETVRMHPLLVTANPDTELNTGRWKEMEPHDVVMECVRLSLPVSQQNINIDSTVTYNLTATVSKTNRIGNLRNILLTSHTSTSNTSMLANNMDTSLSRSSSKSRCYTPHNYKEVTHFDSGGNNNSASSSIIWSPYNEIAGQIPLTPTPSCMMQGVAPIHQQYLSVTGSSPPEAAVEATPETTPLKEIKEMRHSVIAAANTTGIANRNAVRAIFPSQPSSPMRKDYQAFNFSDTNVPGSGGIAANAKIAVGAMSSGEEVTMYDRRIRKLFEERKHSQSPFQTIEMQGTQTSVRSPVDAGMIVKSSNSIESDDNALKTHLIHKPTSVPATAPLPQYGSSAQPVPVSLHNITKICMDCNETDVRMCSSGGLQIPSTRSMHWLAKGIKRRNRMTSYCYNDSSYDRITSSIASGGGGDVKVRRTKSCSSIFMNSRSGSDEDVDSTQKHDRRLQKSGKMLAIATASKEAVATNSNAIRKCTSIQTQTIDVCPNNYEQSLLELLAHTNDLRNLMQPHEILDQFIATSLHTKEYGMDSGARVDQEQLQLIRLQLQYEQYRREIHAERNRRLMGRSRDKRSLEMERDRLREQLNAFAHKNDELMRQIDKAMKLSNENEKSYLDELTALKTKYHREIDQNRCLQQANENLKTRLNEELVVRRDMNYELEALRGELFNMKSELQNAQAKADVGMQCKQELARLEAEFIVMGEIQVRCRDRLAEMDNYRARDQEMQMLQETYNRELKELRHTLDERSSYVDSVKHKIQELQAQLLNNEKIITEQKRLIKTIKDEYEEKLKSVNKKYDVQKSIIMQMEEKIIMYLHKPQSGTPLAAACSPDTDKTDVASSMDRNSPLSTSLQSSESLSASLRSDELRNLQTVVEKAEASAISVMANAARGGNIIEGTRLPALDMASSASTATLGMASAINIVTSTSVAAAAVGPSSSSNQISNPGTVSRQAYDIFGHIHPHLHLQMQQQQSVSEQQQQSQQQKEYSRIAQSKTTTTAAAPNQYQMK